MAAERTNRPKRIPLGTRNVLTAPKREGYVRRFVNDDGDRIKTFEAAGYSVVRGDVEVGDPKAGKDTPTGSVVEKSVGSGNRAVLMEIKKEWYDEDQKAKQDRIDESERDMKRQLNTQRQGSYGGVKFE
jgi:hypothetical protein